MDLCVGSMRVQRERSRCVGRSTRRRPRRCEMRDAYDVRSGWSRAGGWMWLIGKGKPLVSSIAMSGHPKPLPRRLGSHALMNQHQEEPAVCSSLKRTPPPLLDAQLDGAQATFQPATRAAYFQPRHLRRSSMWSWRSQRARLTGRSRSRDPGRLGISACIRRRVLCSAALGVLACGCMARNCRKLRSQTHPCVDPGSCSLSSRPLPVRRSVHLLDLRAAWAAGLASRAGVSLPLQLCLLNPIPRTLSKPCSNEVAVCSNSRRM